MQVQMQLKKPVILDLLSRHPEGLTVREIAFQVKGDTKQISRYLEELKQCTLKKI